MWAEHGVIADLPSTLPALNQSHLAVLLCSRGYTVRPSDRWHATRRFGRTRRTGSSVMMGRCRRAPDHHRRLHDRHRRGGRGGSRCVGKQRGVRTEPHRSRTKPSSACGQADQRWPRRDGATRSTRSSRLIRWNRSSGNGPLGCAERTTISKPPSGWLPLSPFRSTTSCRSSLQGDEVHWYLDHVYRSSDRRVLPIEPTTDALLHTLAHLPHGAELPNARDVAVGASDYVPPPDATVTKPSAATPAV